MVQSKLQWEGFICIHNFYATKPGKIYIATAANKSNYYEIWSIQADVDRNKIF